MKAAAEAYKTVTIKKITGFMINSVFEDIRRNGAHVAK